MIRLVRDFRLVPIVLLATICLFALKTLGLVFDRGYTLGDLASEEADITGSVPAAKPAEPPAPPPPPAPAQPSWAHQMFNYPDITGSIGTPGPPQEAAPAKRPGTKPQDAPNGVGWTPVPLQTERPPSAAERAILERLNERRTELDSRARELEMRESLLKAAEKRLEGRISELKELEQRVNIAVQHKEEADAARFKNLILMYENMKAKDAAKIFDRLELKVLTEVATQLNPRRMSDILAQMVPEAAERLTVELASRATTRNRPAELPKIEGRPTSN